MRNPSKRKQSSKEETERRVAFNFLDDLLQHRQLPSQRLAPCVIEGGGQGNMTFDEYAVKMKDWP